jgi:hypothetical protein
MSLLRCRLSLSQLAVGCILLQRIENVTKILVMVSSNCLPHRYGNLNIKAKHNERLFYIYAILNLSGYDDSNGYPYHSLREKVRADFARNKSRALQAFRKAYRKYQSVFWLTLLPFTTDDTYQNISEAALSINPDISTYPKKMIHEYGKLITDVVRELDLTSYFKNEIENEYLKIVVEIQRSLQNYQIGNLLERYWNTTEKSNGILVPNPFDACHRAWGGQIPGALVSISGPSFNYSSKQVEFTAESAIMTALHEFSHTYAKAIWKKIVEEQGPTIERKINFLFNYTKDHEVVDSDQGSILESYSKPLRLIEEHMVRASETCFLTPEVFRAHIPQHKLKQMREKKLQDVKKQGFLFIYEFEKVLEDVVQNGGTAKEVWEKAIDQSYKNLVQ